MKKVLAAAIALAVVLIALSMRSGPEDEGPRAAPSANPSAGLSQEDACRDAAVGFVKAMSDRSGTDAEWLARVKDLSTGGFAAQLDTVARGNVDAMVPAATQTVVKAGACDVVVTPNAGAAVLVTVEQAGAVWKVAGWEPYAPDTVEPGSDET